MLAIAAELAAARNCLRQAVQRSTRRGVVLVLGNESCDLDSVCCSIALALFTQQKNEYHDRVVAPVLNVKREQFRSRTEVVFWLNRVLLNNSDCSSNAQYDDACTRLADTLVFVDDIDFGRIASSDGLKVKLVDHNRLTNSQTHLEPFVDEIIDHHKVSPDQWSNSVKTEIVVPVGSCSSLITRRFKEEWPSMPSSVALLLYGAIIVDTAALLNSEKTTEIDISAVDYLESKFSGVDGWPDRTVTNDMIFTAKTDVSRLGAFDIFGKDFKNVPQSQPAIGMSTVPMYLEDLASKLASEPDAFERFCRERSLVALVVLTASSMDSAGDKSRKLILYSPEEDVRLKILQAFGDKTYDDMKLTPLPVNIIPTKTAEVYSLHGDSVSRKKLLPMLERYFSR